MTLRARPGLRGLWLALLWLAVLILAVLLVPGQALAHTALQGSAPAAGERLSYPPEEIVLSFATPVRTATTTARLRAADGTVIPLRMLTAEGTVDVIVLGVPPLMRTVYALDWQSVGDDGHRAQGEVVFGVGLAPGDVAVTAVAPDAAGATFDVAAVVLRITFLLGLGGLAAITVFRRAAAGGDGPTLAAALVTRRTPQVLLVLGCAAALRGLLGAAALVQAGGDPLTALGARPTLTWVAVATTVLLARARRAWDRDAALLALVLLGGTLAGHAPDRPDPLAAIAFGAVHVGAAALWTGPLAALVLIARTPAWRSLGPDERASQLRASVAAVGRTAGWALVAVLASGAWLAVRVWEGQAADAPFRVALLGKGVVVLAGAVPLGLLNHRRRARMGDVKSSLRLEAGALLTALVLGAVLVTVSPGWERTDPSALALLGGSSGPPSSCADVDVGRATCYRTALATMLVEQGPQAAIDEVARLAESDEHVGAACHQVAHDLGNDASSRIQDMGIALAVDGSACWSGYTHGFIEARLADVDDASLVDLLPAFCDGAADTPYSFTHYNCMHGLGHGLMLRAEADLFAALPLCEGTGEEWAVHSCASGVFMENVMAAQQGMDAAVDEEDLLYPCTVVDDLVAEDCYLMQTSHVLWRIDGDLSGGFGWCDRAPPAHRATCYRSMGRDISSRAGLDPAGVEEGCGAGRADLVRWCFDGAASNAVYETADSGAADALCAILRGDHREACVTARDQAVRTVAAG